MNLSWSSISDRDFAMLPAAVGVGAACFTAEDQYITYVVVVRTAEERFLLSLAELQALAKDQPYDTPLDALLAGRRADSTAEETDRVPDDVSGRTIVTANGVVTGYYDVARPPMVLRHGEHDEGEVVDRWMCADLPSVICRGDTIPLLVWLDAIGAGTPMHVILGEELTVVVHTNDCVKVDGVSAAALRVAREAEPVRFALKADGCGAAEVLVYCLRGTELLAAVTLRAIIVDEGTLRRRHRPASARLSAPAAAQPDLTLIVRERTLDGNARLEYLVTAADPRLELTFREFPPVPLLQEPSTYFDAFFREAEDLIAVSALDRLSRRCIGLYDELLPVELREVIWANRHRIRSVQIFSDEPWIPWEILQMNGTARDRVIDGPFLCEQYTVTRWRPGVARRLELRFDQIGVITATDAALPAAQKERLFLRSLKTEERNVEDVSTEYASLLRALAQNKYDVWHFCGHGEHDAVDAKRSYLDLGKGVQFAAADLTGAALNFGRNHPLVFFNACHTGRGGRMLTGLA